MKVKYSTICYNCQHDINTHNQKQEDFRLQCEVFGCDCLDYDEMYHTDCGRCDRDGFEVEDLNFIDQYDHHGFCDACWKIIEAEGRVD